MTIPYAHTPRPDSGVSNLQLGTWLFLASDVMFLASLLSGYVLLRASAPTMAAVPWSWLRLAMEGMSLVGVVVAVGAGHAKAWPSTRQAEGTSHVTDGGPRNADGGPRFSVAVRRTLFLAVALALACAVAQGVALVGAPVRPRDHVLIASWFVLVGTHIVHVLGGVGATLWVTNRLAADDPGISVARIQALRLYWIVMLAAWLAITVAFSI